MAKEKILVVDDEKDICAFFRAELSEKGYEVDCAPDAEQAIKMVESKKYDVVFLDWILPGMDGVEACKIIKKMSPSSITIFLTGKLDTGNVLKKEVEFAEAGGKVYFLYKPFSDGEILKVLQKALMER